MPVAMGGYSVWGYVSIGQMGSLMQNIPGRCPPPCRGTFTPMPAVSNNGDWRCYSREKEEGMCPRSPAPHENVPVTLSLPLERDGGLFIQKLMRLKLNSARLVNSIEVVLGGIFIMDLASLDKAHIPFSSPVILVRDTV